MHTIDCFRKRGDLLAQVEMYTLGLSKLAVVKKVTSTLPDGQALLHLAVQSCQRSKVLRLQVEKHS